MPELPSGEQWSLRNVKINLKPPLPPPPFDEHLGIFDHIFVKAEQI